ncbi:profilin, required for normal timing of actin polymerization in response to thermal stress [Dimargaris xerosporica]|nr:profilin, required for normal timing of actin polymerization in response to thermal stress [Dimargaris xerosporica]
MSWQAWADNVTSSGFKQGAIYGQQGGCWAASGGLDLKGSEHANLAAAFTDASGIRGQGLWVNGIKYIALQCDAECLMGRKGDTGVICIKTKQAILIGVYDANLQAGEANKRLTNIAASLSATGY